jgi:hypothetical protein
VPYATAAVSGADSGAVTMNIDDRGFLHDHFSPASYLHAGVSRICNEADGLEIQSLTVKISFALQIRLTPYNQPFAEAVPISVQRAIWLKLNEIYFAGPPVVQSYMKILDNKCMHDEHSVHE